MVSHDTAAPAPRPRPPAQTLSLCLLSMTMAGTTYWAPSLATAIAGPLSLTPSAAAAFPASINLGYAFCVLSGLLHSRLGPRRTAIAGSAGLCAAYLGVAAVVYLAPPRPLAYLAPLGILISTASYCVYGATQTSAVAAFPPARRGAVNGLLSAVYALSAGIVGALEAALFPAAAAAAEADAAGGPVVRLLMFVAGLVLIPLGCAVLAFPVSVSAKQPEAVAAGAGARGEYEALAMDEEGSGDGAGADAAGGPGGSAPLTSSDSRAIRTGYVATVLVAGVLQGCAAVDWVGGVRFAGVRAESVLACLLVLFLSLLALPAFSSRGEADIRRGAASVPPARALEADEADDIGISAAPCTGSHEEPPILSLQELVVSRRFAYMFCMLAILAGCGGLTLVNTSTNLVASRMIPDSLIATHVASDDSVTSEAIARGVRAVVVLFSALGVAGRLTGGVIMDLPSQSGLLCSGMAMVAWRYTLLQVVAGLLCTAMVWCAFAQSWWLLLSAGAVGYCHGLFFSISPAFSQDFFGVASFARDFAVAGVGAGVGASVLAVASSLVVRHRRLSGSWVDVPASVGSKSTTRQCVGVACLAPTYLLCASMIMGFVVYSIIARRRLLSSQ